jgi:hypothetical protein
VHSTDDDDGLSEPFFALNDESLARLLKEEDSVQQVAQFSSIEDQKCPRNSLLVVVIAS